MPPSWPPASTPSSNAPAPSCATSSSTPTRSSPRASARSRSDWLPGGRVARLPWQLGNPATSPQPPWHDALHARFVAEVVVRALGAGDGQLGVRDLVDGVLERRRVVAELRRLVAEGEEAGDVRAEGTRLLLQQIEILPPPDPFLVRLRTIAPRPLLSRVLRLGGRKVGETQRRGLLAGMVLFQLRDQALTLRLRDLQLLQIGPVRDYGGG